MGSLSRLLPITFAALLIGTAAITGFPFFSGFYSKDLILEQVYLIVTANSFLSYSFLILTAFFTIIYSLQIVFWAFFVRSNVARQKYFFITESNKIINFVLFSLSMLSIFVGYCLFDIFGGNASPFLGNSIFISSSFSEQLKLENIRVTQIKNIPLFFGGFGLILIFYFYNYFYVVFIFFKYRCYILLLFFTKKWHFDLLYNYIGRFFFIASYTEIYQVIDKGFLEYFGPRGLITSIFFFSKLLLNLKKITLFGLLTFLCFNFGVLITLIFFF
jgi:NADH:ubiquinone oxidoreductase subunit 5 (subunit L)/multisubunit Na+/H+ antiporter MnhA subunit